MKKNLILALAAATVLGLVACNGGGGDGKSSSSTPIVSSSEAPVVTSEEPVVTSEEAPVVTSEEAPVATSEEAPVVTSEAPVATSEPAPVVTSEAPVVTSEPAPVVTSEELPVESSEELPVESSEELPVESSEELPVESSEEIIETSEAPIEYSLELELSNEEPDVGDKIQLFVETDLPSGSTIGINAIEGPLLVHITLNEEGASIECLGAGNVTILVEGYVDNALVASETISFVISEPVIETVPLADVLQMENKETFVTKAFYLGGQTKVTQYQEKDQYKTIYFGTQDGIISTYNVLLENLPQDLEVGDLCLLAGTISNLGGGEKEYVKHQFYLGSEGYIQKTEAGEGEIFEMPSPTLFTIDGASPLSADLMDKLIALEGATVSANSVNNSGNRSVTLKLGEISYSLYFNGKYVDSSAWADVNVKDKVNVTFICDVNDYNGSVSYQGTAFFALEVTEHYVPEDPEQVEVSHISDIDLSEVANMGFTDHLVKIQGVVTSVGKTDFLVDDGSGVAVVYNSGYEAKLGEVVEVCSYVENYYKEVEFAKNGDTAVIVKALEGVVIENLYVEAAEDLTEEDDFTAFASNKDSRPSLPVILKGKATSATELDVYGEKVILKYANGFELEEGVEYRLTGYIAGYNGSKKYFNFAACAVEAVLAPITEYHLDRDEAELEVGGKVKLEVIVNEGASAASTWSVDEEGAEVVSVDENGVVTALAAGTAVVTATSEVDQNWSASCTITVAEAEHELIPVSATMEEIKNQNNWTVSTNGAEVCYTSFQLDDIITVSTEGEPNCGSYWEPKAGKDWRLYQAKGGNIVLNAAEGYVIENVTFTYLNSNNGALYSSLGDLVESGVETSVKASSATFDVKSTDTSKTNGQVRLTAISVSYYALEGEEAVEPVEIISAE